MQTQKRKYFPSSFLVIIAIMVLFIIASWIGMALTDQITGIGLLDVFTAIWHGFVEKAEVILFIFAIGGTLGIMTRIKAIDAGIGALVKKLGDKVWLLIPALMIIFGLGGATYGMWEETIAFIPVLLPVFKKANYGPFTAILVILLGAGTGCLASTINPFAVGAAVSAVNGDAEVVKAGIEFTNGTMQGTRWISFVVFEIFAISMVVFLANRYKKAHQGNFTSNQAIKNQARKQNKGLIALLAGPRVVEGIDHDLINKRFKDQANVPFTVKRKISLILFIVTFLLMIIMYLPWADWFDLTNVPTLFYIFSSTEGVGFAPIGEWYFVSVAALFLLTTIIIFALNFKDFKSAEDNVENNFISTYMDGVKDMVSVCLIIATAAGLGLVLEKTGYSKLIAENAAKGLNTWISYGLVIFIVSLLLSLLIPSTSGFAGSFMPIFAQIAIVAFPGREATAIGLAMMGFLFANGLANFITPTSAALMGYTAYAGVPYNVWVKETWKIVVVLFVLAFLLILFFSIAAQNGSNLF